MNNDLITNFIEKDIAINLRTHEAYFEFMKLCEERGLRWLNGDQPTRNDYWDCAEEETCVVFNFAGSNGMSWVDINEYSSQNWEIFKIENL